MKIDIKATNMDLTPSLTDFVKERVAVLDKFIPEEVKAHAIKPGEHDPVEAYVEVAKISKHHKHGEVFYAEINLKAGGKIFRAEMKDWDLHVALDGVREELKIQLEKEKGVRASKFKRGARMLKRLRAFLKM